MNLGQTVFSQVVDHLPRYEFLQCVARYRGDYQQKSFSCWDQFLAMAFAQLTYRESLRDIEACLRSMSAKLYHMGFRMLELHGNIPTFIRITDGTVHDVNMLDQILPEAGAFYVMDRGYIDFERLYRFTLSSAFFVVRTKSNVLIQRRYSHLVDKATGVRSDHTVILTAINAVKAYPDALRRVSYLDVKTKKRFKFLTNNFMLPALTIAQIYKSRWQVELFFEDSTWCTPLDVMEFQGSVALN